VTTSVSDEDRPEDEVATEQPPTGPHVLVVEDETELASMLARLLSGEGYVVDLAADGQAGLHRGLTRRYDVLVIDRGLPGIEGLDLLQRLRRRGVRAPALMLTAYDTVPDRVEGLDGGAQDYLGKPFDVDELLARLRALVRRADAGNEAEMVDLGGRSLDLASRCVVGGDVEVALSEREADLLQTLAGRPTRVFSREELRSRVFSEAEGEGVVETYVSYLRRKLGPDAVRTVRGIGYRMGKV
jgi:two-component system response regulator QseB